MLSDSRRRESRIGRHRGRLSRYQRTVLRSPLSNDGGAPAELALDLQGIDRVAPFVAGPVGHAGDQPRARADRRRDLVEERADRFAAAVSKTDWKEF
jgi:hypothetical protein